MTNGLTITTVESFIVSLEPDIVYHELEPRKDKFLLLASHALWGVMNGEEDCKSRCPYFSLISVLTKRMDLHMVLLQSLISHQNLERISLVLKSQLTNSVREHVMDGSY